MRVKPTQQVDRAGVSWIEHLVVTELGWLFRQQETADFGIDAQLEIVDSETSKATGRLIGVQIKSGLSYFGRPSEAGWWFGCSAEHTSYWVGHSLPVVVMLYHPTEKMVYWQHVSEQTVQSTGKNAKIQIPRLQSLASHSAQVLGSVARSVSEVPALEDWAFAPPAGEPQRAAYFEHLLSARLCAMVPGVVVDKNQFDGPWDLNLWVMDGALGDEIGVRLALQGSPSGVRRIATEYRSSFLPLVIFYTGTRAIGKVAQRSGGDGAPPVYVVAWRENGVGKALQDAILDAIQWVKRGSAFRA
ncbi:DUF4365 domain-containing protein [Streptomyces sp. NPDC007856]|uniref:DUF4365 domain-containing protein n=1 Tax=Streptomyces sp. NPDC007856 TaxID=3364781 RepID=UPI00367572A1